MGEVWTEIMGELEIENVRPVSPDLEALETIGRAITEDSRSVVLIQTDLLRAQNDQVGVAAYKETGLTKLVLERQSMCKYTFV